MRNVLSIALGGLLLLSAAGSSNAATLDFTGTLQFGLSTLPALQANATGTVSVNDSAGGVHLNSLVIPGGAFGPITQALSVTSSDTVNSVRFTGLGNGTGSFGPISGGPPGGGVMGLVGLAKICLVFDPSCTFANVPVPLTPTPAGGIGVGGTQLIAGAVALTMQHSPWTIGQPVMTIHNSGTTVTTPTLPGGFAHGPASQTSSTAQQSGVVQLVSVTKVFTSLTAAFPELPIFTLVNLHFTSGTVPEPGTLLLLGSGIVGLVMVGRRSRKR